jgi:geranylgeranyl reductase family protein
VPPSDVDLLVVGAGPAGIAAALEARRLGIDPLVVDKAHFPRDKTCGDGLTAAALHQLEDLGLDVRTLPSYAPVSTTVIVSPHGRQVEFPMPEPGVHAAVVTRRELDDALVQHARAHGVDICEGTGVVDARTDAAHVTVEVDGGLTVRARWVIAADGHYSTMRHLIGPAGKTVDRPVDLGTWHAFRQYYRGVDDRRMWVVFEPDLLPGYGWVFPLGGGRANVGFGVLRDRTPLTKLPPGKELAALWRSLADRPAMRRALGDDAQPEGTHRSWPIPAHHDPDRLACGRALFVGDAAGVVDAMTGEGIAQALETGALAARAIAHHGDDATAVAREYRDRVAKNLGRDLKIARTLQRVLRSPGGAKRAIALAGLNRWTRRNFARWMFEDYPRALVFTPGRWHRRMFKPDGAYIDAAIIDGT